MPQPQNQIRSPLSRARGLGSARNGVHHWWMQRLSAAALIPLSLYWLCNMGALTENRYDFFISRMGEPVAAIAAILFILASFYHACLGVQVIVEDYVHTEGTKIFLLALNKILFFFMGAASVFSILYINFALYGHSGI